MILSLGKVFVVDIREKDRGRVIGKERWLGLRD